jgi:hypothetical protein
MPRAASSADGPLSFMDLLAAILVLVLKLELCLGLR